MAPGVPPSPTFVRCLMNCHRFSQRGPSSLRRTSQVLPPLLIAGAAGVAPPWPCPQVQTPAPSKGIHTDPPPLQISTPPEGSRLIYLISKCMPQQQPLLSSDCRPGFDCFLGSKWPECLTGTQSSSISLLFPPLPASRSAPSPCFMLAPQPATWTLVNTGKVQHPPEIQFSAALPVLPWCLVHFPDFCSPCWPISLGGQPCLYFTFVAYLFRFQIDHHHQSLGYYFIK